SKSNLFLRILDKKIHVSKLKLLVEILTPGLAQPPSSIITYYFILILYNSLNTLPLSICRLTVRRLILKNFATSLTETYSFISFVEILVTIIILPPDAFQTS